MKRFILTTALVFLFFIISSATVQAATLYLSPSSGNFTVGDVFTVNVLVNTEGQAINAAEATVNFPSDFLEVISINKTGSVFTLWVEEPSFSNYKGTISFIGGLPTPGFNGKSGKIISVVFRGKKSGSATLIFSSGIIRANDGYGTNILKTRLQAQFNLITVEVQEMPSPIIPPKEIIGQPPAAPIISSPTHPDENKWYSNNSPLFKWNVPSDVNTLRLLIGRNPTALPNVLYKPPISERQLENLDEGVWYFSAQFRNEVGWGVIGRFKVQIDTEPPEYLTITEIPREDLTKQIVSFKLEAKDKISGISHYEIWINGQRQEDWKDDGTGVYTTPRLEPGEYKILIRVVDFAGNYFAQTAGIDKIYTLAMVIAPVEPPVIVSYPPKLTPGDILVIEGTGKPFYEIEVWVQKLSQEPEVGKTQTNKEGKFKFTHPRPIEKGTYKIWAIAVNLWDSRSEKSNEVEVLVELPFVLRIGKITIDYLTMIITLIALIVFIILIVFYAWYRISLWHRRLRVETKELARAILSAFKALREEMEEQIEYLDKKPGMTQAEREVRDKLKEALNISEEFIGKEIKDIEKELE